MLYTTITIGNKDYKLRLNARACVELEKKLGKNPLNIFAKTNETGELPKLEDIIEILHASLQPYNHGITIDDTYDLYDKFVDDGNTLLELIPIVLEIFKVSGFFKEVEDNKEKN